MPKGSTNAGDEIRLRILRFIARYIEVNRFAPTFRDIMEGAGLSSTSVVKYHLERMRDAKEKEDRLVEYEANTFRTLRITEDGQKLLNGTHTGRGA